MLDLVIFDADGVLFESAESNMAYYNAIFAEIGEPPLSPDEERACIFLAAMQVFELRADEDAAKLARMREIARTIDFAPFFKLLRPPFELRPFLLELKRRYRVALATNRSATTLGLIEHLGLDGVFDAAEIDDFAGITHAVTEGLAKSIVRATSRIRASLAASSRARSSKTCIAARKMHARSSSGLSGGSPIPAKIAL